MIKFRNKEGKSRKLEIIKLTEAENNLFKTQALIHELRHYFQYLVLLKSKEVGPEKIKEAICNIRKINPNDFAKKYPFLAKFKQEDATLEKAEIHIGDNKFISVEDIFKNFKGFLQNHKDYTKNHDSNINEKDANNYSNRFIRKKMEKLFSDLKIRQEVKDAFDFSFFVDLD